MNVYLRQMTAYLLLGSNEGDRLLWLNKAMEQIARHCGSILKQSSTYRTAAWGIEDQPDFLNIALEIDTKLSAEKLLSAILEIELKLGRHREVKWGQRTIDIDILFYGSDVIDNPGLKVPHPYLQERRFALVPLNEIAPDYMHPVLKKTNRQLLQECNDPLDVHPG